MAIRTGNETEEVYALNSQDITGIFGGGIPGLDNGGPKNDSPDGALLSYDPYKALVNIMRRLYPDSQTYKDGILLGQYVVVDTLPQQVPSLPLNNIGSIQIETNPNDTTFNDQGYLRLTENNITNIVPADGELVDELIDDTFSFFEEDVFEELPDPPEIENDVFFSVQSIELVDAHATYLERGPSNGIAPTVTNPQGLFVVFYIQQGKPRPIPNYETLEVMLVERGLEYDSVGLMSPEQIQLYEINSGTGPVSNTVNYAKHVMPNRVTEWNLEVRLKSGYEPVAPFVRDPGDYYDPDNPDENGNPYDPLVYQGQTALEAMRDRFEGKMVCFNVTYRGSNDQGKLESDIIGADINSVRIMTYGYWKWPLELETYRSYNEFNNIGAQPPTENFHINWLDRFNKAGFLTSFQGGDSTSRIAGWNDFPHIVGVNTLDPDEYQEYYDSTSGDIFENEYLEKYEPRGSVKYYSAGVTTQLSIEAIETLEELESQLEQQESLFQLRDTLIEDMKNLKNSVNSALNGIGTLSEFKQFDQVAAIREQAGELRDDLCDIFHPGGGGRWRLYKNGKLKGSKRGFFRLIEKEMKNAHEKKCVEAYILSHSESLVCMPVDLSGTDTCRILNVNDMTARSSINEKLREAGETLGNIVSELILSGLFTQGYGSYTVGGAQMGQMANDLKARINNFFNDLGNRLDAIFAMFGRHKIQDLYINKGGIQKQISTYRKGTTWGSSANKDTYDVGDVNGKYYPSPVFGAMTPFDESIENLLGSETYADQFEDAKDMLINIKNDLIDKINFFENVGSNILPGNIVDGRELYDVHLANYQDNYSGIQLPTLETLQGQFDIIAKRWIGKAHNTINFVRREFQDYTNSRFYIRYNSKSRDTVQKYFPGTGDEHFGDKKTKLINITNIF